MISLIRTYDLERWKRAGPWVLVYGRRKTGKSFFVRNCTKWDHYFFVGRGGEILEGDETLTYDTFMRVTLDALRSGKRVVIDEIQRLPREFHDRLHALGVQGHLTAVSSTIGIAKSLLQDKSPLLGLFSEFRMDLIDERDVLAYLSEVRDPKLRVELAAYLREPWLLPIWKEAKDGFFASLAEGTRLTVSALLGEIFSEEQRQLSATYEGILAAVADGKRISGEIASSLFSRGLIRADNPSLVHPYLQTLVDLGLLEKVKVHGKNRFVYRHVSPVTDLHYYLDSKYSYRERDLPGPQLRKILGEKLPLHVEQFLGRYLSKSLGLQLEVLSRPDHELDIALTDFQRISLVGEVKWKQGISETDVARAAEVLGQFNCRRLLIVPQREAVRNPPAGLEIQDAASLAQM